MISVRAKHPLLDPMDIQVLGNRVNRPYLDIEFTLLPLPVGGSFLDESLHAFFLVLAGK